MSLIALVTTLAVLAGGGTIAVRVPAVRSSSGSLVCRLFSKGDGFPGKATYQTQQSVPIVYNAAVCTFSGLAPGSYAVAVFHDENGNGKLDTNFIGIPREGVGVSNNRLRKMGAPRWDDAKFTLSGDTTLDVNLRY